MLSGRDAARIQPMTPKGNTELWTYVTFGFGQLCTSPNPLDGRREDSVHADQRTEASEFEAALFSGYCTVMATFAEVVIFEFTVSVPVTVNV